MIGTPTTMRARRLPWLCSMCTMRPSLPKYVQAIAVKGSVYYYFRYRGLRTRLPDDPGSPEFYRCYSDLLENSRIQSKKTIPSGTLQALIRDYKDSPEFEGLRSRNTKGYYSRMLDEFRPVSHLPISAITRQVVMKIRDSMKGKPRSADQFIQVASRLFSWAMQRNIPGVSTNPAALVMKIGDAKSFEKWSQEDIERFKNSNPPQWMMTAFMLASYASPRRGDVLKMRREQYDGIRVSKRKKREAVKDLYIPCHADLRAYLNALPTEIGMLVPNHKGRMWDPSRFSKIFRDHLDSIELADRHFHGLRHTCATALAEAGCSDQEIMAITGHSDPKMVQRYTQNARQKLLAEIRDSQARTKQTLNTRVANVETRLANLGRRNKPSD